MNIYIEIGQIRWFNIYIKISWISWFNVYIEMILLRWAVSGLLRGSLMLPNVSRCSYGGQEDSIWIWTLVKTGGGGVGGGSNNVKKQIILLKWSSSARKLMKIFWAQTFSTKSLPGQNFYKLGVREAYAFSEPLRTRNLGVYPLYTDTYMYCNCLPISTNSHLSSHLKLKNHTNCLWFNG